MKYLLVIPLALGLVGCAGLKNFTGTSDPCAQGAALHAGWVTVAATQPKLAKYNKAEATIYAGFKAQCVGGLDKVTLTKALEAYSAALAEWKS